MTPGATEFWRAINAGADTILNLQVHYGWRTSTMLNPNRVPGATIARTFMLPFAFKISDVIFITAKDCEHDSNFSSRMQTFDNQSKLHVTEEQMF
jgi:hypothetical protein